VSGPSPLLTDRRVTWCDIGWILSVIQDWVISHWFIWISWRTNIRSCGAQVRMCMLAPECHGACVDRVVINTVTNVVDHHVVATRIS